MIHFPNISFPVEGGRAQYDQSLQLAAIAGRMKVFGWKVDRDACRAHHAKATERQARFRALFAEYTGIEDMGKDGQLQCIKDYFWDVLKAPVVSMDKKTKKKKLDAAALVEYCQPGHPEPLRRAAAALYGYRKNGKVIGYMEEYLNLSAKDGRVHPSWNIWGTKTSRWSCSDPNIQQLSGRSPKFDFGNGEETLVDSLKNIMVADDGFVLVGADYSALELYIQTYIAQAAKLLGWIEAGEDLHMNNARGVLGPKLVPANATKKTHKIQREIAKLFFGFAYNGSDNVTQVFKQMKSKMPALTELVVSKWRSAYFRYHAEFPSWQEETKDRINEQGFIDTPLMKRRLYLAATLRGYNQGLNGQAQITAGDLCNVAVLRFNERVDWTEVMLLAQVHDSIIAQCRPEAVADVGNYLTHCMTAPVRIYGRDAKFAAEPDSGVNWNDMSPF
jgi:DNA polymerase-1